MARVPRVRKVKTRSPNGAREPDRRRDAALEAIAGELRLLRAEVSALRQILALVAAKLPTSAMVQAADLPPRRRA